MERGTTAGFPFDDFVVCLIGGAIRPEVPLHPFDHIEQHGALLLIDAAHDLLAKSLLELDHFGGIPLGLDDSGTG
jgi:hypothetical protein